ncbi:MAG: tetratricopeptide repeat protein [Bryobacteraceae bacterium]
MSGRAVFLFLAVAAFAQAPPSDRLYRDAVTLGLQGNTQAAISKYEQFLKLHPESVGARTNLGVELAKLGKYDEAIENYKIALSHDSLNATVRLNLALAWYKQSAFDKAAGELTGVRRVQPQNKQALYLLADCDLRLGRYKDAIALVDPAYQATPDDRALAYVLGVALIKDGQIEKGKPVIDRILAQGETAEANLLLGASALAAGDDEKALKTLRRAVDLDARLPGIWSLYGRAQMEINDNPGAEASFRKALQADANDFDANLDLGALLRHDGDFQNAATFLAQALRLRPSSLTARFQMGALDLSLGRFDEARAYLEGVARESPDFQPVHVQLASLYFKMNRKVDSERERQLVLKLNGQQPRP